MLGHWAEAFDERNAGETADVLVKAGELTANIALTTAYFVLGQDAGK